MIEVLTTAAIIGTLMGITLPVLTCAKERGRRAVCQGNMRQFLVAVHMYSSDHRDRLPSGLSDRGDDEHTPVLSSEIYAMVVKIAGDDRVLRCPWIGGPFDRPGGWSYPGYGQVLGYNYLGGHMGTPWTLIGMVDEAWISPQTNSSLAKLPILTELNAWTSGENRTFAPHGPRGPILRYGEIGEGGLPSARIGGTGGNIGRLDGSVSWKAMREMRVHRGSRAHGIEGCFTAW